MTKNLTQGSVFRTIVVFSLPYLLSYFLQTLYGMADLFIVGQYNGAAVISAVSIGSQIMHMITVILVGLAMGTTVLISRAIGAKAHARAACVIGNSAVLFFFASLVLTALLLALCPLVVAVMKTPAPAVSQTRLYLAVCFSGIPFITAYNLFASVYRGLGDSKSPLYFVSLSCILNIVLDYVFVGYCGLEALGAALATVISQAVSACAAFIAFRHSSCTVTLTKSNFRLEKETIGSLLKIGLPVAFQDGFIQISFLLITMIANRRGVDVAAAVGIVEKIICFLFLVPSSMLSAISAIAAQNLGAHEHMRARKTLLYGALIAVSAGLLFACVFQYASEAALRLFTKEENVITLGTQYLKAYVFDCIFAAVHFAFSGFFCAYGFSIVSFVHNVASIALVRVPGAWLSSKLFPETLYPMGWAAPLGSLLSALICIFAYLLLLRKGKLTDGAEA